MRGLPVLALGVVVWSLSAPRPAVGQRRPGVAKPSPQTRRSWIDSRGGLRHLPGMFRRAFGVRYLHRPTVPRWPAEIATSLTRREQKLRRSEARSPLGRLRQALRWGRLQQTLHKTPHRSWKGTLSQLELRLLYRDLLRKGAPKTVIKTAGPMGLGLFAGQDLLKGTVVGEYAGAVTPRHDSRTNGYLFQWGPSGRMNGKTYVIDGKNQGNETRFVNHSSRRPNLQPLAVFHGSTWHIVFVATRKISRNEQLLFDYGSGYWSDRGRPAE
jgi:hypothetical protein